jgi:hypothetical protein
LNKITHQTFGKFAIALLMFAFSWTSEGQERELDVTEGFLISAGLGYTFAQDAPASYYNGAGYLNNLENRIYNNTIAYRQIQQAYNNYDWQIAQLPQEMFYENQMGWLVNIYYYFKDGWGIYGSLQGGQFTAQGLFTTEVFRFNGGATQPFLELEPIKGVEQRLRYGVGVAKIFSLESPIRPFVELGWEMNWQRAMINEVEVAGLQYSIFNGGQSFNPVIQTAMGSGLDTKLGVQIPMGTQAIVDAGLDLYMATFKLRHEAMDAPSPGLDITLFLRFSTSLF